MPRSRPPYPPEFRAEAVRLVREGGRLPEELARDLGCTGQTIRNWLKQADLDAGRRHDGLTTAEREELRRLRAENRTLRMERDLLRKVPMASGPAPRMEMGGRVADCSVAAGAVKVGPNRVVLRAREKSDQGAARKHRLSLPLGST